MSLRTASLVYLAASTLNALVPFVLLSYLARVLGPADVGRIGVFLVIVNLGNVLAGLNTHGLISIAYFREGGDRAAAVATKTALLALAVTFAPLLLVGVALAYATTNFVQLPPEAVPIAVVCSALQFAIYVCLTYFQCSGQALRYGALSVGVSLAVAATTVAMLSVDMSWRARALGQLIASAVIAIAATGFLSFRLRLASPSVGVELRRAVSFGLPLVPHSLAVVAMSGYDRLYISGHLSSEAAGQYFGAAQIASMIGLVATAFNQAWVPWLYSRLSLRSEFATRQIVRVTWLLAICGLAGALLLAVVADPLVRLVLGEEFSRSAAILRVLAPAAAIGGMYFLVANHLFFAEKTGWLPVMTCLCALLQLALIHVLGSARGDEGVAWAVLLSQFAYVVGLLWLVQQSCPVPWLSAIR